MTKQSANNKARAMFRQEVEKQKPSLLSSTVPTLHSTTGNAPAGIGNAVAGHSIPLRYTPLQSLHFAYTPADATPHAFRYISARNNRP